MREKNFVRLSPTRTLNLDDIRMIEWGGKPIVGDSPENQDVTSAVVTFTGNGKETRTFYNAEAKAIYEAVHGSFVPPPEQEYLAGGNLTNINPNY